jgi:predicted SAM-dependent methyltransferase
MKVEIGPRWSKIGHNWVTVDMVPGPLVDHIADWSERLPFEDESVSLIYASHTLEHLWWFKTVDALKEAYRVLRPDGVLELHVPDFRKLICAYIMREPASDWKWNNPDGDLMKWINGVIYARNDEEGCQHHAVFDRNFLFDCLIDAGFRKIQDGAPVRGASKHPEIDLAVTAVK